MTVIPMIQSVPENRKIKENCNSYEDNKYQCPNQIKTEKKT